MIFLINKSSRTTRLSSLFIPLVVAAAVVLSAIPSGAQRPSRATGLKEDQRILHVLNRLGFGARPGDVARVKAIGVENYVNQQLQPEKISDPVAGAKLKDLTVLKMTTAQLYEKFPQPGRLLRQMERRGQLPDELASAREARARNSQAQPLQPKGSDSGEMGEMAPGGAAKNNPDAHKPEGNGDPRDNQRNRQAMREYYRENGLQLPRRMSEELQASRILRAVYSERQLQEVMVDFWSNHFNVFAGKGADRWLLVSYDRDTIRPNTLGKFSDLLLATAQSPAMLFYLDNFQSVSPNAQLGAGNNPRNQRGPLARLVMGERVINRDDLRMSNNPQQQRPQQQARRGINENYARELMELHTLGVDGGYTQKDVQEIARCFTGWTILAPRGAGAATAAMRNGPRADMLREHAGTFFFNHRAHDDGEKIVLGQKIPAGGGMKDGLRVIEILAQHPSTAKFIATKLARHFVSDNPPPALVDRAAATFTRTKGDIREMLRTIFLSPEFNSAEAYRAKVKRPFELTISAIRTLGAETTGGPQLQQWMTRMGEPLYGFQTPNGYSDAAESWVNTGGLLERMNFGLTLASNRIPGTRVDLKQFAINAEGSIVNSQILDRLLALMVAGDVAAQIKETLLKQMNEQTPLVVPAMNGPARMNARMSDNSVEVAGDFPPRQGGQQLMQTQANITDPLTKVVGLILGSPEFQRQ